MRLMSTYYLAGSYTRRAEIAGYAAELRALGHAVTSRWLDGEHEAKDRAASVDEWEEWVRDDIEDINAADAFVAFTEEAGNKGRGGRHVEWGYAIACGFPEMIVIGPVESMFYTLADEQYDTWAAFLATVKSR